jgi:hypothetical protein
MSKSKTLILFSCIALIASVICVCVVHDVERKTRIDWTLFNIKRLGTEIEKYRDDHGVYPQSLAKLLDSTTDPNAKADMQKLLSDRFKDQYEYQSISNGFIINVSAPRCLFMSWDKIGAQFETGKVYENGWSTNWIEN